ncbi:hypothetical protein [Pontibacterium sp.]|uniref:hypothetical protein n=1 Tax=Pontibacterium sp. TaxID=2036026 RepID=UPI00356A0E57
MATQEKPGAKVPTPPKKKKRQKGEPPSLEEANHNNITTTPTGELVPMNFKVDDDFHSDYKITAITNKTTMVGVLRESLEIYKKYKAGLLIDPSKND